MKKRRFAAAILSIILIVAMVMTAGVTGFFSDSELGRGSTLFAAEDEETDTLTDENVTTDTEKNTQEGTTSDQEVVLSDDGEAVIQDTAALTYKDDDVTVTVEEVDQGAIPEGASLSVTPIVADENDTEMNAAYNEVADQLSAKAEEDGTQLQAFLAYDICLVLADGTEVEPAGNIKVSMDYADPVAPEGATEDAEISVMHLEENDAGEVEQVVNLSDEEEAGESGAVEKLETTDTQEVENVEFVTGSCSTFTITWSSDSNHELTVHLVDANGTELSNVTVSDQTISGSPKLISSLVDLPGYTLQKVYSQTDYKNRNNSYYPKTDVQGQYLIYSKQKKYGPNYCWHYGNSNGSITQTLYAGELYFFYQANPECAVTFNSNGGTFASGVSTSQTVKQGQSVTLPTASKVSREGYTFLGWSANQSATTADYTTSYTPPVTTTNTAVTLYAVWEKQYGVIYNANGGKVNNADTYTENATVGSIVTLPTATWSGYTFEGWSTDSAAIKADAGVAGASYTVVDDLITLYAVWDKTGSLKDLEGNTISMLQYKTLVANNNPDDTSKGYLPITWTRFTGQYNANSKNSTTWDWNTVTNGIGTSTISDGDSWTYKSSGFGSVSNTVYGVWDGSRSSDGLTSKHASTNSKECYLKDNTITVLDGKMYDSVTWLQGKAGTNSNNSSYYRIRGTFNLNTPENGCDYEDYDYTITSVTGDNIYINDNMYVFVYPTDVTLTNDNYLNYLAFWAGNAASDNATFHGKSGYVTTRGSSSGLGLIADGLYVAAPANSAGSIIQSMAKAGYTGSYYIDVITEDQAAAGGMYRLQISAKLNTEKQAVTFYKVDNTTKQGIKDVEFSLVSENESDKGTSYSMTSDEDGCLTVYVNPGTYTLSETETAEGYEKTDNTWTVTVASDGSCTFTLKNSADNNATVGKFDSGEYKDKWYITNKQVQTINVNFTKQWNDYGYTSDRPSSVVVKLVGKTDAGKEFYTSEDTTVYASENWSYTWSGVPATDNSGNVLTYEVQEISTGNSKYTYTTTCTPVKVTKGSAASAQASELKNSLTTIGQKLLSGMTATADFLTGTVDANAAGSRWTGGSSSSSSTSSSTSVDHIDVSISPKVSAFVDGEWVTIDNVTLEESDADNLTLLKESSSGTETVSPTGVSTSSGTSGVSQIRLEGTFDVGTKADPVYYTVTLNKVLTYKGKSVPVTISIRTNYWDLENDCPGLGRNPSSNTTWTNGGIIRGSGIDVVWKDGANYISVQKDIEGVELTEDKVFTFDIYKVSGSTKTFYRTVNVTVQAGQTTGVVELTCIPDGEYEVVEDPYSAAIAGYTVKSTITDNGTTVSDETGATFKCTNTYTSAIKEHTLTVKKTWTGDTSIIPDSVNVLITYNDGTSDTVTLKKSEEWTWTSKSTTKSISNVKENTDTSLIGEASKYKVSDCYKTTASVASDGESASITNTFQSIPEEDTDSDDDSSGGDSVSSDSTSAETYQDIDLVMTNTLDCTGVTLTKVWEENDGVKTYRPTSVSFTIYKSTDVTFEDGKPVVAADAVSYGTFPLSVLTNTWTRTVYLPQLSCGYTAIENDFTNSDKYETTYTTVKDEKGNCVTITNTLIYKQYQAWKVWDDSEDAFGKRPTEVTAKLYLSSDVENGVPKADTNPVQTVTLNSSNGWKASFTDLVGEAAKKEYTIVEDSVQYYTSKVTYSAGVFTLTNTLNATINWNFLKQSTSVGYDAEGNEVYNNLADAEFTLSNRDKNYKIVTGDDGYGTIYEVITDAAGSTTEKVVASIDNGSYTLKETTAPAGFSVSDVYWTFDVNNGMPVSDSVQTWDDSGTEVTQKNFKLETKESPSGENLVYEVTLTVTDTPIYALPRTGGPGIYGTTLLAILMLSAAAFLYYRRRRALEA